MILSTNGLQRIKDFEECPLVSYQDSGGVWTIGYGHTGPDVGPNLTWTQSDADFALYRDTLEPMATVNRVVKVTLTQDQFDALVSFVYNVGSGAFVGSTMLRLLNAGDYDGAADEFQKWDQVHGTVIAGLLRRRIAEEDEFEGDDNA